MKILNIFTNRDQLITLSIHCGTKGKNETDGPVSFELKVNILQNRSQSQRISRQESDDGSLSGPHEQVHLSPRMGST